MRRQDVADSSCTVYLKKTILIFSRSNSSNRRDAMHSVANEADKENVQAAMCGGTGEADRRSGLGAGLR